MNIKKTDFPGLIYIEPRIFGDSRGWFLETWNEEQYKQIGITGPFVQDNISYSSRGVVRGLHYQKPYSQGKLIFVIQGSVWDVVVDLRKSSPKFGKWIAFNLTEEKKEQLYVPAGFAHGFCVLSDSALFQYKCTDKYSLQSEQGIMWNDPHLNIPWPVDNPLISNKDQKHPCFKDLRDDLLF